MKNLTQTNVAALDKERRAQKVSLARLAELTEMSKSALCNVFSGKSQPHMETLIRVGNALGMKVGTFDKGTEVFVMSQREANLLEAVRKFEEAE